MKQISLQNRIDTIILRGYVCDMDYMVIQEQKWADMPIRTYLKELPEEYVDRMISYLIKDENGHENMTYQEAAVLIYQMIEQGEDVELIKSFLRLLEEPLIEMYTRRIRKLGKRDYYIAVTDMTQIVKPLDERIQELRGEKGLDDLYRALQIDVDCYFDGFNQMSGDNFFNDSKYFYKKIRQECSRWVSQDFFQHQDLLEAVAFADLLIKRDKEMKRKTSVLDSDGYALLYTLLVEPFYKINQKIEKENKVS